MKIKDVMYNNAISQLIRVLDIEIDRAKAEDRDEDYDKLVDIRYYLDEMHGIMLEVFKK